MGLVLVTPPAVEPVTLLEAMNQVRLDTTNIQQHPTAPVVALASPVAPGNVDNGAHRYRVTFVTADGETDGGDLSASVTVADKSVNGQVVLTAIPIGRDGVTARKIYRTAAAGSSYFLVATIANNTTATYTDNVADASLGVGVPTINTAGDPETTNAIANSITAARLEAEHACGMGVITQTWAETLDCFPWGCEPIRLRRGPVRSVTSITYLDSNGSPQTLSSSVYVLDSDELSAQVSLAYGQAWPAHRRQANAVTVTYVVGYGDTAGDVQAAAADIRSALLLRIEDLYRNRGVSVLGQTVAENPAFPALLQRFRRGLLR